MGIGATRVKNRPTTTTTTMSSEGEDDETKEDRRFTTPRSRAGDDDGDGDGDGGDGGGTSVRRRIHGFGGREDGFRSPERMRMDRKSPAAWGTMPGNERRGRRTKMVVDVSALRRVFERIDANGDGEIRLEEFLDAWSTDPETAELLTEGSETAHNGRGLDEADKLRHAQDVFDKIDADHSESVSFEEFVKYFEVESKKRTPGKSQAVADASSLDFSVASLKTLFDMIDENGDGEVSLAELLKAWVSEPEIGNFLRKAWQKANKNASWGEGKQRIQEIFHEIDDDRNESVSFAEFVQYFQGKSGGPFTGGGRMMSGGPFTGAPADPEETITKPLCCLSLCIGSNAAEHALKYAERTKMPQPKCCLFCCVT